jgi:hypothetical protein
MSFWRRNRDRERDMKEELDSLAAEIGEQVACENEISIVAVRIVYI